MSAFGAKADIRARLNPIAALASNLWQTYLKHEEDASERVCFGFAVGTWPWWRVPQFISLEGGYAMHTYDFSPMFRHSVGFDRMQRLMDAALARTEVTYPPYNIETDGLSHLSIGGISRNKRSYLDFPKQHHINIAC